MKRLALPAWVAVLVVVTAWLRCLAPGSDTTFAAARAFALAASGYLLLATVVNIALALCRVRVRLPLVPLLVVASLTAPLVGTPAFAVTPTPAASSPPPVMHRITDALAPVAAPPAPVAPSPAPAPVAPTPAPAPTPVAEASHTWTERHGQNFWSIAAQVMRMRLGRPPTTGEVAAYWRPLIAVNRTRLVRPADPSLLYAGQVLVLP